MRPSTSESVSLIYDIDCAVDRNSPSTNQLHRCDQCITQPERRGRGPCRAVAPPVPVAGLGACITAAGAARPRRARLRRWRASAAPPVPWRSSGCGRDRRRCCGHTGARHASEPDTDHRYAQSSATGGCSTLEPTTVVSSNPCSAGVHPSAVPVGLPPSHRGLDMPD
jgi:hypothetical protein